MMFSALPLSYRQRYEELSQALGHLCERVKSANPEELSAEEALKQVQQVYQDRIVPLSCEGLDPAIAPRWQSMQTEINRALRLLHSDLIFLQASRQAANLYKRQQACLERIEQLLGYCQRLAVQD